MHRALKSLLVTRFEQAMRFAETLEKQRNALSRDLAVRDARVKELEVECKQWMAELRSVDDELEKAGVKNEDYGFLRGGRTRTTLEAVVFLAARVAGLEAERDRWREDSERQTKTIARLGAAAEDRNQVDASVACENAATITQLQTELAALADAKQKMWVRLCAAENAKQAGDVMIADLMAEREAVYSTLSDLDYDGEAMAALDRAKRAIEAIRSFERGVREICIVLGFDPSDGEESIAWVLECAKRKASDLTSEVEQLRKGGERLENEKASLDKEIDGQVEMNRQNSVLIQMMSDERKRGIGNKIAACTAHRACCSDEQDITNGKLHGYCVVCGVPWPCPTAQTFINAAMSQGEAQG